jgi:hypothetical protein
MLPETGGCLNLNSPLLASVFIYSLLKNMYGKIAQQAAFVYPQRGGFSITKGCCVGRSRFWTAEKVALLGVHPDQVLAKQFGVSRRFECPFQHSQNVSSSRRGWFG